MKCNVWSCDKEALEGTTARVEGRTVDVPLCEDHFYPRSSSKQVTKRTIAYTDPGPIRIDGGCEVIRRLDQVTESVSDTILQLKDELTDNEWQLIRVPISLPGMEHMLLINDEWSGENWTLIGDTWRNWREDARAAAVAIYVYAMGSPYSVDYEDMVPNIDVDGPPLLSEEEFEQVIQGREGLSAFLRGKL